MKKLGLGLLLPLFCINLTGCDLEDLKRMQQPQPQDPVPCDAALVATGRSIWFFKLGEIAERRVELYSNDTLIWTSEKPDEARGWVTYYNGVLKYMSWEDFEELRLEEKDQNAVAIRAPINLKLLNGQDGGYSGGCGGPVGRPPQMYFDFSKLTN